MDILFKYPALHKGLLRSIKDKGDTEYLRCLQCRQNTKPKTRSEKDVYNSLRSIPSLI